MKKILLSILLALMAPFCFGQSYPSPTYNNLTVVGTFTATGKVTTADLATQAANSVLANVTGSVASPTAAALPSCSTSSSALTYTSGTGFTCNTAIAASSATTASTSTTQPLGNNTTNIATTAFVQNQISAIGVIPNASGLTTTTTGSITTGTNTLTVAAANGFANGQGIMVIGAGPLATVVPPTGATATPQGVTGSTTWHYAVSTVDANGGVSATTAAFTTSTGNATLQCTGTNNYNLISWTAASGASGYIVYKFNGTQYSIIGLTPSTNFYDCGSSILPPAPWVPNLAPGAATSDWLLTSISSGGGTTSLTLANNATTTVSGATVLHDDTAAINAAINALPANGGIVNFANTTYPVSSQISMGNGTSSTASTTRGVILKGVSPGAGFINIWSSYNTLTGSRLLFQGVPGGPVVTIIGPLQGWGVENLMIDANDIAQFGLLITSAQFGDSANILVNKAVYGVYSTTFPVFGGNTDAFHNYFRNISVIPPDTGFSTGLVINGTTTSDTDYNHFDNVVVANPQRTYQTGIVLASSDSNVFTDMQLGGSFASVQFAYGTSMGPSANIFFAIDPGTNGVINTGTVSGEATNWFYGTLGANGGTCPTLTNLTCK